MWKKTSFLALLASGSLVMAADPEMWYGGAFEVEGTARKTTTTAVDPATDGVTRVTLAFQDEKSNQGYFQFPLQPKEDFPACEVTVKAEKDAVAEVWVQGGAQWYFQEKLTIKGGDWKSYPVEFKEVTGKQATWIRLIFPNKVNPMKNILWLKNPQLVK